MNEKPSWLTEKEITLENGSKARWSYDSESDMLEIFFQQGKASCTVKLADGVFLRLDLEQRRPLSIAFLAVSSLVRYGEWVPPQLVAS